jgi:hypothetical protein
VIQFVVRHWSQLAGYTLLSMTFITTRTPLTEGLGVLAPFPK